MRPIIPQTGFGQERTEAGQLLTGYNPIMPIFQYFHPIEVRYGDLDPQGHVNNAKYLTYMEQARIGYIHHLGLWAGGSFLDIGIILADAQVTFLAPILFSQAVRVGVQVTRLGNKSLTMEYLIEEGSSGQQLATGTSVLVTYDYHASRTIPIPEDWRRRISQFEGLPIET
jgi:acyl-CoA thioester hydrolase